MNTLMKTSMLTASLFAIGTSAQAVTVFSDDFDAAGNVVGTGTFANAWVNEEVGTPSTDTNTGIQAQSPLNTAGNQYVFFNVGDQGDGPGSNTREGAIYIDTGYANAAGTIYTLTYDILDRDDTAFAGTVLAELYVGDPTGSGVLLGSFTATQATLGGLANAANNSHGYVGTGDAGNIFIRFHAPEAPTGFDQARLDNVSLDAVVPEPGSLALLGLGSIAMLRRRRSM